MNKSVAIIFLKNFVRRVAKLLISRKIPLNGFAKSTLRSPLDNISDNDLMFLNKALDWNCFTTDVNGRRFGNVAWNGKRSQAQLIPDSRIVLMNKAFDLSNKSVLEVGCFEGVHTIGLQMFAKSVIAIDSRIEHIVKTVVRSSIYGFQPNVFQFDADGTDSRYELIKADTCHHVGVLYHLKDPVRHILKLGEQIKTGIMLDTHIADDSDALEQYSVGENIFHYKKYLEFGSGEVFSGMHDHSKWLTLSSLKNAIRLAGFLNVTVVEIRHERNGPRVLLFAEK